MLRTAEAFMEACRAQEWKWKDSRDLENGKSLVVCGINGEDTHYDVRFFFDQTEESVAIRVFGITRATQETFAKLLITCNQLNNKFHWMKFCIDDDQDVNVEHDAVISVESAGEVCVELLRWLMGIVDKAYPDLMRAQYGN